MRSHHLLFGASLSLIVIWLMMAGGCAQIGFPTGGMRDSLPPVLINANPPSGSTGFDSKKIVFEFNEYVDVQEVQKYLLVSPAMNVNPMVTSKLRTVTIQLKDSLADNTTYHIQLGDAIRDINEGNLLKSFSYVFSTGKQIDSLKITGKVTLAQSGEIDSSLLVLLFKNMADSAVEKLKPEFVTRLNGEGMFSFGYLPSGTFRIFALKDNDGSRNYNSPAELFAFYDSTVQSSLDPAPVMLYAFQKEKVMPPAPASAVKQAAAKKLMVYPDLMGGQQSLIDSLKLGFSNPIVYYQKDSLMLTDSNKNVVSFKDVFDSTRRRLHLAVDWKPAMKYKLIIYKGALKDSAGNELTRNDTIDFMSRSANYYGRIALRFPNYVKEMNPVLQMSEADQIKFSFPLTSSMLKKDLIPPGEYSLRILLDQNGNGQWDPGDYKTKKQPERCLPISQKLTIRSDWDNERDISY